MGSLSVAETLLSAGIIGIIYAVLSGQPLVLIGITGYVIMYTVYTIHLYNCSNVNVNVNVNVKIAEAEAEAEASNSILQ